MERTYSQDVARAFEIVDYFLLVPAGLGALMAILMIGWNPLFTFLVYGLLSVGVVLLVGYFKHSRATLNPKHISALWITSALYNFLLLLPSLYYVSYMYQSLLFKDLSGGRVVYFLINLSIVFAYITAIILSLKAYSLEKRKSVLSVKLISPTF